MPAPRLLVVYYESFVRALVADKLADAGFDVDQAPGPRAALRLMETGDYALLVTEVNLPGRLNGVELAKRANETRPGLSVIVVTPWPEAAARLRQHGIKTGTLSNAFALAELVNLARELTTPLADGVTEATAGGVS